MKTTISANPRTVKRDWFVVDATDKVLGRLAVEVSRRLRGKHKPEFTPHVDTGDYIVVVNVVEPGQQWAGLSASEDVEALAVRFLKSID